MRILVVDDDPVSASVLVKGAEVLGPHDAHLEHERLQRCHREVDRRPDAIALVWVHALEDRLVGRRERRRIAPEDARYAHDDEGPDDMPAHIRTMLTGVNLSVPVVGGRLGLGTWQGIYLAEHRRAAHRREVVLHVIGG